MFRFFVFLFASIHYTIQSPTYKLSKLISPSLSSIIGDSPQYIRDSWQFAEFIKTQKIPKGYKLASLDAKSLFTNVSKNLSILAIKKRWRKLKDKTTFTQQQFVEAIKMIIEKSYFRFGTKFFIQKFGLAMGNCISGFLAELVMEDLEKNVLPKLPFLLTFYKRYVDDILLAILAGKEDEVLKIFNGYDKNLQFTIEHENNKSINFLDMTITRNDDGDLTIKWFQKEVASGRYLNYNGHNPISHKRNVITGIVDRAITFTNPEQRPDSLSRVRTLMKDNGYPPVFTEKIIKQRVDNFYNNNANKSKNDIKYYISAPYIPGLSDRLKKSLAKHGLGLSCKATNTVGNLYTKTKYTVPFEKRSKVTYEIPCKNCPETYNGESKQKMHERRGQHKRDVKNKKIEEGTALSQHATNTGHEIDFDKMKITNYMPKYWPRRAAESLQIMKCPMSMNKKDTGKTTHLKIYNNIFKNHPKTR